MKTAISIGDELYEKAERYAKAHQISRSELYQRALSSYLTETNRSEITRQLNEVFRHENSALPEAMAIMQARTIKKSNESW